MKKNMIFGFLISLLISFSVLADVINPIGEENLGYLRLNAPVSVHGSNLFSAILNSKRIDNQKDYRLLKGDYCFSGFVAIYFGKLPCFTISPKQTTVFDDIAVVELLPTGIEDVGHWDNTLPKAHIMNTLGKEELNAYVHNTGDGFWIEPGNYNIVWSDWLPGYPKLATTSFSVAKGQSISVPLTTLPKSYVTEVTFSKIGNTIFPDAVKNSGNCNPGTVTNIDMAYSKYLFYRELKLDSLNSILNIYDKNFYESQTNLTFKYQDNGQSTVRFYPYLGVNYTLVVNGVPAVFQFSQPGLKLNIPIQHVDVNKVTVTREDSTTYTTSGSYVVDVKINGQYQRVHVPTIIGNTYGYCLQTTQNIFNTETGLDLPPNEYKFTVYYSTLEGKDQFKEYFLDLR